MAWMDRTAQTAAFVAFSWRSWSPLPTRLVASPLISGDALEAAARVEEESELELYVGD